MNDQNTKPMKISKLLMVVSLVLVYETYGQPIEEKDIFSMSLEELMNVEITTASKRAQKISDAPATVISFSAAQIEQFGWRDLKDMFRALTGVDVSYDVQGEVKTLVTMRGVEGNQKILVLQDGQRQNPITGERFIFGHNIPLSIYKRIEIVYGPASALYGADAYAGVINLITKDGSDIDGYSGSIGYISTQAIDGHLSFGKKIDETTDILLFGRIYNGYDFPYHKYYTDSLDYGTVNTYTGRLGQLDKVYPIKNWNLLGKIRYKKFLLGFDWQHQLESNAPSAIPSNYAYVRNNVWGQDIRHIYGIYDLIKNENFNLETLVTLGDYEINPASNFFIPIDTNNDNLLDSAAPGYKYGYSGYLQLGIKSDWMVNEKLNFIAGLTADNVISFPKTKNLQHPFALDGLLEDDLSQFVDTNGYTFGMIGLTDSVFGKRNYKNFGAYVQAQYSPFEKLSITLGGRFDYNSIYKETFNPRVGVIFKTTEKLTFKALVGTAFIAPSNYYRWENWANPYAMHIPNLNIKPEKLRSYEVSGIYFPTKSLSLRASIFRNDMTDIIRPIPAGDQPNNYPYYNPLRLLIGELPNTGFVEINTFSNGESLQVATVKGGTTTGKTAISLFSCRFLIKAELDLIKIPYQTLWLALCHFSPWF